MGDAFRVQGSLGITHLLPPTTYHLPPNKEHHSPVEAQECSAHTRSKNTHMARLNSRQWLVLVLTLIAMMTLVTLTNNKYSYSLTDISTLINSLEVSGSSSSSSMFKTNAKVTDNRSPDLIAKHEIENKVNELLKKKVEVELEVERKELEAKLSEMKTQVREAKAEATKAQKERDSIVGLVQVAVEKNTFESEGDEKYTKNVYSFRTQIREDGSRLWDYNKNELVILSSFTNAFGKGRTFEDFFVMLDGLKDIEHPMTSISLLIGDAETFDSVDKFINGVFNNIKLTEDIKDLADSFTKITLIHAPFLESKLSISRVGRQKPEVQKQRRRTLAQMRNFLVSHGVGNEVHTLYLDSDVIELPDNMLTTFIDSKVDIATVRIDMKNPAGVTTHPDYDLNAWAGSRIKPSVDQEREMDEDPEYFFEPKPGNDAVHMLDLSNNREQYGLTEDKNAKYELRSVGGAILFAKANVYRQGAWFPPYYVIGTSWDRREGWDGVETEGLCYVANAIGYKCWGFPNMIGYHTA